MSLIHITSPSQYYPTASFRDLTANNLTAGQFSTDKIILNPASASNPSLSFSGDTDTGIYSSATNIVSITTNSSKKAEFSDGVLKFDCLTPSRFQNSFTSQTTSTTVTSDTDKGVIVLAGQNGSYTQLNEDNSTPGIRLMASTTGETLMSKNALVFIDDTYSNQCFIVDPVTRSVRFPVNISTPTGYIPSSLRVYEELSISPTWTGISSITSGDGSISMVRVGNNVTLTFNTLIGSTPGGQCIVLPGNTIPARFRPLGLDISGIIRIYDNSNYRTGSFDVNNGGGVIINHSDAYLSTFGNHANSGFFRFSVSYNV